MTRMKKWVFAGLISLSLPLYSLSLDEFFRTINLEKLIDKNLTLNLEAQMKDPDASTKNVNNLNDFVALGYLEKENLLIMTEFDENQNVVKKISFAGPWVGVGEFNQEDIPPLSLQEGLRMVQICMAEQGDPAPDEIMRLVVYRTVNTSDMVYDYIFKNPNLPRGRCEEFLYTPRTKHCQRGMIVPCHHEVKTFVVKEIK